MGDGVLCMTIRIEGGVIGEHVGRSCSQTSRADDHDLLSADHFGVNPRVAKN